MSKIKFLILFTALLLLLFEGSGKNSVLASALLIIRTRDRLWVATDSKAVNGLGIELPNKQCKLHRVGNLLLGIVGATADADEGWNAEQTAVSIAKTDTSPQGIVSA